MVSDEVLVTGATGFVGAAVCRRLDASGIAYRVALRRPAPGIEKATHILGQFDEHTDWRDALRGVRLVFHVAGRAHVETPEHPIADLAAVRGLARAAIRAGVERLMFLSSVKVNGETSPPDGFSESDALRPENSYARSKAAAEECIRSAADGLPATIIRAPLVYGPGVKANFLALIRAIDRGVPLPLGRITRNQRSLIFVQNLADAIVYLARYDAAVGETYFVSDGEDVSTVGLIRCVASALDRPARLIDMPVSAVRLFARITCREEAFRRLTESLVVDTTKIRAAGWYPPVSLREGLAATAQWFRAAVR